MADREDINIEEKKNCKVQSDCTDEVILSQSRWISNASKKKKDVPMLSSDISNLKIDGITIQSIHQEHLSNSSATFPVLLAGIRPDILGKDKTHPQISGTIRYCSFFQFSCTLRYDDQGAQGAFLAAHQQTAISASARYPFLQ